MIDQTAILNLLQKVIQKKLENRVPEYTPLLTLLKRNKGVVMYNNDFYVTEVTDGFSNIGQFPVGAALDGGDTQDAQFKASAKNLYAPVKVEDKTLQMLTNVPEGAIADFSSSKIAFMEKGISREFNRTYFGVGDGVIARADGSGSNATSLTVQGWDVDNSDISGGRHIRKGDYIKIGSGNAVQVSAKAGNTITLAAARSWSDEDDVVKISSDGHAAEEMEGLGSLVVNTGTVQNVNIANYENLQATVDNTSHSFASNKDHPMNLAWLETEEHREGSEIAVFMNKTNFAAYGKTLTELKRTAKSDEVVYGGVKTEEINRYVALVWQGGKVFYDPDCPTKKVYIIEPSAFTIGDLGGGVKFASALGSTVWQRVTGYTPQYEAVMRYYGNLIIKNPAANAVCTAYGA